MLFLLINVLSHCEPYNQKFIIKYCAVHQIHNVQLRSNSVINASLFQALALIELYNAPEGRYKQDVYLLPKKMGEDLNN